MTIICGTDFSHDAAEAARIAAQLAARLELPLKLVHALPEFVPLLAADLPDAVYEPTRVKLREQAEELRSRFGANVETATLSGPPDETLIDVARATQARLIVLSAIGGRKQRAWLTGSVAERVAQCSPVPVLVVRDAERLRRWLRGDRALRVMVGVALDASSKAALRWVERLRAAGPCEVSVVQVAWPWGEGARFGIAGGPMDALNPQLHRMLLRDLRVWAGDAPGDGATTFVVSPGWGRVDTHLTLLAAEEEVDLLVTGRHQRSLIARLWQGSVCRGVIHGAPSNAACVPAPPAGVEELAIPTFRSVLVPTDFSRLANRAVPIAYAMLPTGGVVHLLHVGKVQVEGEAEHIQERLRGLVPPGATARGIATEVHVVEEEEACTGIWHHAARLGVDAICMSTHGRSGVAKALLGSQALEVLRRARQPVFLVPPERDA